MTCAALLILFHPDYDRRFWHLTRSADHLSLYKPQCARGLTDQVCIPPVGNLAPP